MKTSAKYFRVVVGP